MSYYDQVIQNNKYSEPIIKKLNAHGIWHFVKRRKDGSMQICIIDNRSSRTNLATAQYYDSALKDIKIKWISTKKK